MRIKLVQILSKMVCFLLFETLRYEWNYKLSGDVHSLVPLKWLKLKLNQKVVHLFIILFIFLMFCFSFPPCYFPSLSPSFLLSLLPIFLPFFLPSLSFPFSFPTSFPPCFSPSFPPPCFLLPHIPNVFTYPHILPFTPAAVTSQHWRGRKRTELLSPQHASQWGLKYILVSPLLCLPSLEYDGRLCIIFTMATQETELVTFIRQLSF